MTILVQTLLVTVILSLTILVVIAGIQVFHILHEFRTALQKLNRILAHTHTLSSASAKPISAVNDFFVEVKSLIDQTQDEIIDSTPDRVLPSSSHTPTPAKPHHFFRRSGLPLRPS